jgi:hypothetical protein
MSFDCISQIFYTIKTIGKKHDQCNKQNAINRIESSEFPMNIYIGKKMIYAQIILMI